ncbi:hypothetical protein V493_06357 [Pseudogymnoascus sp. VKM F-4281 (FW-2241)]|nr:hypothetical protein V493_06357 [Pseudogymnoascus sp. VKM F-4281 (FW-2241)]
MSHQKYTPLAADPGTAHTCSCGATQPQQPHWARRRSVWLLGALGLETLLLLGFAYHTALAYAPSSSHTGNSTGLLDPQSFLPPIPLQTVIFEDETPYRDIGPAGDELWNDLMPSNPTRPFKYRAVANTLIKRGKVLSASRMRASMISRPANPAATVRTAQRSSLPP